jgi:hypothetical protein
VEGLLHVHGCWAADNYGNDTWAEGDYWTVACLINQFALASQGSWKPDSTTIRWHVRRGRFPVLRLPRTRQILIEPVIGEFLVKHVEPFKTWPTVRVEADGVIRMFYENYGSRIHTAHTLRETGQLHEPPAETAVALPLVVHLRDQGVHGQ